MISLLNRPLVSVILASYNHENYVGEAIKSVLNQGVDNIEVIVIDDASTDGTASVVKKINDPRIKLIRLPENRRYHPRNIGLKLARGKYIAFQNSDDRWEEGKLKKQIDFLEKNPNTAVCFTGVEIIDNHGKKLTGSWANNLFVKENKSRNEWLRFFFDCGNCFCISSALVSRKTIKKAGYFKPSFIQLSDFDMWVRLTALGDIHVIPEKLTNMRVVKEKNISAPSEPAIRRSSNEYTELLNRFLEKPLFGQLETIFRDVLPDKTTSQTVILGGIAKHAWTLGAPHILFANNIISKILDDPKKREELVSTYGVSIIHEYIKNRGKVGFLLKND